MRMSKSDTDSGDQPRGVARRQWRDSPVILARRTIPSSTSLGFGPHGGRIRTKHWIDIAGRQ
jgi:hypothetical protein